MNYIELQEQIYKFGEIAEIPNKYLKIYEISPQDGTPHIEITDDAYEYIIQERGFEISRRKTKSTDDILFIILFDIITKFAYAYELENRNSNMDSRRMVFEKRYKTMNKINVEWGSRVDKTTKEILKISPYIDEVSSP